MDGISNRADPHAAARAVAERVLLNHGARIIERGWSCPEGSVDFVAVKDGVLVLADARMAESAAREDMERPVTAETVERWERVALALAMQSPRKLPDVRFDMIVAAERPDGTFLACHRICACALSAAEREEMLDGRGCAGRNRTQGKEDGREVESDSHSEPKGRRGKDDHRREPGRGAR